MRCSPEEGMAISKLAVELAVDPTEIVKVLFLNGKMASVNQIINKESVTLVATLANATRRFLVFAAARPHQGGTGHLPESMLTKRQWVQRFNAHGLVLMPRLSNLVSQAAYPEALTTIAINAFLMRAADAHDLDDAEISSRLTRMPVLQRRVYRPLERESDLVWAKPHTVPNWGLDLADPIEPGGPDWKEVSMAARAQVKPFVATLWPELYAFEQALQRCPRSANARDRPHYCC